jgi:hypothetical protein
MTTSSRHSSNSDGVSTDSNRSSSSGTAVSPMGDTTATHKSSESSTTVR